MAQAARGSKTFTIGTQWQIYTVSFTPDQDRLHSTFNVSVGANTGSIWFDEFALSR